MSRETIDSELCFLKRYGTYAGGKPTYYGAGASASASAAADHHDSSRQDDAQDQHYRLAVEKARVSIMNARYTEPTLERNGFMSARFTSGVRYEDFFSQEGLGAYVMRLEEQLKSFLRAPYVRVVDCNIHNSHHHSTRLHTSSSRHSQEWEHPDAMVKIDFSHSEAVQTIQAMYGPNAAQVLQSRWQIISTWSPIRGRALDCPLAICDARTFRIDRDAQLANETNGPWTRERVLVHYDPDQRWYYLSKMQPSETLLFKSADSDGRAIGPCPYGPIPNAPPREYVETKAVVIWMPDEIRPPEVGSA